MCKRKHDENGFSAIEALLILVIVVIVGFVGWYVVRAYNRNKEQQVSTQPTNTKDKQIPAEDGWLIYSSTHSTVEFQYPKNWNATTIPISSNDVDTLESVSITGTNNFVVQYSLKKTNHNTIIHNASCVLPPKVTVLSKLENNLAISYSSYSGDFSDIWLGSTGDTISGYGFATGQCRVRGVDYISLPNDEYVEIDGSYVGSKDGLRSSFKTSDFLNQPEVKTTIDVLKSFRK